MSQISERERRRINTERKALERERDALLRALRRQISIITSSQTERRTQIDSAREDVSYDRHRMTTDKTAQNIEGTKTKKSEKEEGMSTKEVELPEITEEDRKLDFAGHWTPGNLGLASIEASLQTPLRHYQEGDEQDVSVFLDYSEPRENLGDLSVEGSQYSSEEEFRTFDKCGYSRGQSKSFGDETKDVSKEEQRTREMLYGVLDRLSVGEYGNEPDDTEQFKQNLHGVRSREHYGLAHDTVKKPDVHIPKRDDKEYTERGRIEQTQLLKLQQLKKTEEKLQLLRQEQQKPLRGMEKIVSKSVKKEVITDPSDRRIKDSEGSQITDRIELLLNEEKKLDEHRLLKEKREVEMQERIKALERRESLVKEEALKRQRLIKMKEDEDRLEFYYRKLKRIYR